MAKHKTHHEECDILVVGGGMAGTGATFEARHWGRDLKIICVEKANIDRSGAVAQGLYAINCYMGMQWNENQPEDHVRYARNDLMGLVREDLGYDMARHVDSTVHMFDEWGLPMMKNPKTGRYQREGKWQIMIHGESYKPIVAEAAKKSADKIYNRIMITHLLMDENDEDRVGGLLLHVQGNVTGQFNQDMYSEILRGGRRVIMLNDDTIEEQEFEDELKGLQSDLRKLVHEIFKKKLGITPDKVLSFSDINYPQNMREAELDGRQKATLIKNYIDGMEKLLKSKKYKEAVSDMMFDMIAVGDYEYNEITMERVKLLAIYVTNPDIDRDDVDELRKQFKVSVYPDASRSQIDQVLKQINL